MFRWVGLGLAIVGAIMAVWAGSAANIPITALGVIFLIIGFFVLSRPNF